MAKEKIIRLNKARSVFPNEVTRLRAHDLISISVEKKRLLTIKEQERLQNLASEIREGLFGTNTDILAVRKRKQVRFIKF